MQCGHVISPTFNTLHIISHHRGGNIMKLLAHLNQFFSKHIAWVAQVGKQMLDRKGLPVEYFANHVADGKVPLDTRIIVRSQKLAHSYLCFSQERNLDDQTG